MNAQLFLSASDATPMYQQVMDQVTARVMAGDWSAGTALPSIRELASANRISVITVKRAYDELERAGVIVTRHGKGSFVAESPEGARSLLRAELSQHLRALLDSAARLGLPASELRRLLDEALATTTTTPTRKKGHRP